MLFTNQQMDDIVGFRRHKKRNFVSQLGLDATFQLGPFFPTANHLQEPLAYCAGYQPSSISFWASFGMHD